ncbi:MULTISPECIES: Crp/Fnr family transcriptional regulator [Rhodomicrobium]|uniref:Crp/Fnr family transcriptional regulator n=1 Tax=Rhodomicrobium TaxID=1068 RepID=UPI000B4B92C1|nr:MULTISPECIES: Crp/Fnr family transcriptional regulator [Rhodomicrobium]
MTPAEQSQALRQISIFQRAAQPTLDRAAALCRWQRHPPGTIILSYQDASTDIFFILEGAVRAMIYAPDGKAMLFTDLDRGEIFGEIAAIDGGPRSASIEALQPTLLAVMSAGNFELILQSDTEVSSSMLRLLTSRVRRLSERAYEFRAFAVQHRIHADLLRLAKGSRIASGEVVLFPAPTLAEIADRVSTHREAVSRELSRLGGLGLIVREGGALRITDIARLAELVREVRGD